MTSGAFGDLAQRRCGIQHVEHVIGRLADTPLYRDLDVDDVLVLREHGGLVRDGAHLAHVDAHDVVDEAGVLDIEAGLQRLDVASKAQHDAAFLLVDEIGHVDQHEHEHDEKCEQPEHGRAGAADAGRPPTEQAAEAALQAAHQVLQIRRSIAVAAAAPRIAAPAPGRFIPSHFC
jgi:hypothetical protein